MKKKIKITEEQLKMLKEESDEYSSLHKSIGDYMRENGANFETAEQLIKSISQRLSTAVLLKEWPLVEEVFGDVYKFEMEKLTSKEDVNHEIGIQSSVLDDTPEEHAERNYGVEDDDNYDDDYMNESINKIKSQFKRFL